MRTAVFSTKPYDERFLTAANGRSGHDLVFLESRLTRHTASLAEGFEAVCAFVNDILDDVVLARLRDGGTRLVALRSAGFNHVDIPAADRLGLTVVRVPAYSPHSVAEHTVALVLALDRQIHRAHARVREGNFALEGLLGFDLRARTVGVIGTGKIGVAVAEIMRGFGCPVVGHDVIETPAARDAGIEYVSLEELFTRSDIITLHAPLTPDTHHLIDERALEAMKEGVMIINTSRGALIDTTAVIEALKTGKVGHLGLDVYEEEADLFFEDLSNRVITDDVFSRLLTFPNVLVTGHQAFFTSDALEAIATTTIGNLSAFEEGRSSGNEIGGAATR